MDPRQRYEIDKRFMEQNIIIEQLRNENSELEQAYRQKDHELQHYKDINLKSQDAQKNTKKDLLAREKKKHLQVIKAKNREIIKIKEDMALMSKFKDE